MKNKHHFPFSKHLIIIVFILCFVQLKAQKQVLVFYNKSLNKSAQIPLKGMLTVEYAGYLKQLELSNNSLVSITDSSIILGKSKLIGGITERREIKIDDITGFRKISAGRMILKSILTVATTLGSYYTFSDNTNMNATERLILSTATGIGTRISINLLFPDKKIKYKVKNGWKIITL